MRKYPRLITTLLNGARTNQKQRAATVETLKRLIEQNHGSSLDVTATRALLDLFIDGTLGFDMIEHVIKVGEIRIRKALEGDLGEALKEHIEHVGSGNDAADNLAWWYCDYGLSFDSIDVLDPVLLHNPTK